MKLPKKVLTFLTCAAISIPISIFDTKDAKADEIISRYQNGCAYSATYKAWWGTYTYLNSCAITDVAYNHQKAAAVIGLAAILTKNRYTTSVLGAGAIVSGWNGSRLSYCKDKANQAYIRYAFGNNNYITGNVSCY